MDLSEAPITARRSCKNGSRGVFFWISGVLVIWSGVAMRRGPTTPDPMLGTFRLWRGDPMEMGVGSMATHVEF